MNALRRFLMPRWRVWKEVVWRPWVGVVAFLYFMAQLYQWGKGEWLTPDAQERWCLPNILPSLPLWGWLIGWLALCLVIVLEGAYRSVSVRDGKLNDQAEEARRRALSEPALEVIFDAECPDCWDAGTLARLAVWNPGGSADDVRLYLSGVKPGPNLGKLQLPWVGEGHVGTQIHNTTKAGHHHVQFMVSVDGVEPFAFLVDNSHGTLSRTFKGSGEYQVELLVEARGIPTRRASVVIRPRERPPIVVVSGTGVL